MHLPGRPRGLPLAAMAVAQKELQEQLVALKDNPAQGQEGWAARRALVRYGKCDDAISASEDWVRLFVALRRTAGPTARITTAMLKQWRPQVSSETTLKRKCYLVDRKALDALPAYPPDLDKWVIPKDEILLPTDIYSDDMIIIDDGYDRSLLNFPGVMHIECGARSWKGITSTPSRPYPAAWPAQPQHLRQTAAPAASRALPRVR